MQITFFDSESDELSSYQKGQLFERFTRRLVDLCGYQEITLRVKHSSLEYDIEAESKLTRRKINGEAKAHENTISGKEIAAFVGKMLPLAMSNNGLDGLFISTSQFTPEGSDYLRNLSDESLKPIQMTLRTLVGPQIVEFLTSNNQCISENSIRSKVKADTQLESLDVWYVIGHHGDIIISSCGPTAASAPTHFIAYSTDGCQVTLKSGDISRVSRQIADLQGLSYFTRGTAIENDERAGLPGILAGSGWFDYKFPSSPECFIGRLEPLDEIIRWLGTVSTSATSVRTLQILSRSGVGKSSLLLKIAAHGDPVASVTVDARNLLTPSDMRLVVSDMAAKVNQSRGSSIEPAMRQEDLVRKLEEIGAIVSDGPGTATLQVDQFEALLARPNVFAAWLDLVIATTERALPIVWIVARKNDLATTYDQSAAVDLSRLNEISRSIELEDFSTVEEEALIERLEQELGRKLSSQLAEAILTFSAGFPWLLKRVCAHVLDMTKTGIELRQLAQGGLRAEDLFDEDLAGLDESDKALLRVLAAHLPNTAAELSKRLEGEVSFQRLTGKLNDFLGRKLLRLSGSVYDTYNDVFKSYLLTGRVPFQTRYVFRVTPGAALGLLPAIADESPTDVATFAKRIGGNQTAVYNKLRELRLLGFIDPQPGRVALSVEAAVAVESDSVGDFLRKALRGNALVSRTLDLVTSVDDANLDSVAQLLRSELPHIRVSDATWYLYASILANWLRYAGIVELEGGHIRKRDSTSDEMVMRREFTLGNFASGTFVPSSRPDKMLALIDLIKTGPIARSEIKTQLGARHAPAVLSDAKALNLVEGDDLIRLTAQGRALFSDSTSISKKDIAVTCLGKQNIQALMVAGSEHPLTMVDQQEILRRFGSANWSDQTWKWRLGIISTWVVATGQMVGGRKGLRTVD